METSLMSESITFQSETEAIEHYFTSGWTDGLPIILPTEKNVIEAISHSNRDPSEVVGMEPVKNRTITVEKIAINSVMAGCKPEYFPSVLASIEAVLEPEFNLHAITASTMGAAVLAVISGPEADKIGINGVTSVFGPGHRANATIGRAIRLTLINATGSRSGEIDKATLGHPGKYTWCMTENIVRSPFESLGIERGFSENQSSVTVFAGLSPIQVSNHSEKTPETILNSFSDALFAAGQNQGEIIIVFCPEHAKYLGAEGWTKVQVKDYLYDMATRSNDDWGQGSINPGPKPTGPEMTHSSIGPDSFTLMVAGGNAGAFSCVIPIWGGGSNSQSVSKLIG